MSQHWQLTTIIAAPIRAQPLENPLVQTTRGIVIACLGLLMSASSCTSATKRLEQGQQLEQQGRRAEAARRYIDALRKDRNLTEAQQRLLETGNGAVDDYTRDADNHSSAGRYMDAADTFRGSDALLRDASEVGVVLRAPNGYPDLRRAAFDPASAQAIEASSAAIRRADFSEALRLVARAQQDWEPNADQQSRLNRAGYDVQASWARGELAASRFRSAYEHANAALAVTGFADPSIERLQAEALRRGTVLAAAFPTVARGNTDARILAELNDVLALEHWQRPPIWINIVNPIETQRVVRNRGLSGRELTPVDASALTRQLGARYAVTMTLDSVRFSDVKVERHRVVARTRSGADTAYVVEDGRLEMWARVAWRILADANILNRGDANDRATTQIRRAVYAGNWRDLDLNTKDRALFEAPDPRNNQDMQRQLARDLSATLGRDVLDALLKHVD